MNRYAILTIAALGALATTTHAGLIVTFTQSGSNVVATGSGTLNTAALYQDGETTVFATVDPIAAYLIVGSGEYVVAFEGISGPSNFGSASGGANPSSTSGNIVGIDGLSGFLYVPPGYSSGSQLSESATFNNTTISGLGLAPGTYTYTWGFGATADFFQVAVVPEPSSLILLGSAIGVIGFGAWVCRRRGAVESAV